MKEWMIAINREARDLFQAKNNIPDCDYWDLGYASTVASALVMRSCPDFCP